MSKSACAMAILVAAVLAAPAAGQDKKSEKKPPIRAITTLMDNDKVLVTESTFRPGEENSMAQRAYRITRVLKGSTTIERRHADGKVEKLDWKEGNVYQAGPDNASTKNIGKSAVVIYTVSVKPAK